MNGRMCGDLSDDFPCISSNGSTVIDSGGCSWDIMNLIRMFQVGCQIGSEHILIVINSMVQNINTNNTRSPSLIWKQRETLRENIKIIMENKIKCIEHGLRNFHEIPKYIVYMIARVRLLELFSLEYIPENSINYSKIKNSLIASETKKGDNNLLSWENIKVLKMC